MDEGPSSAGKDCQGPSVVAGSEVSEIHVMLAAGRAPAKEPKEGALWY